MLGNGQAEESDCALGTGSSEAVCSGRPGQPQGPAPPVRQEPLVALALSWELHSPGPGTPSVLTGNAFAAVLVRSAVFGLEYSGRD